MSILQVNERNYRVYHHHDNLLPTLLDSDSLELIL